MKYDRMAARKGSTITSYLCMKMVRVAMRVKKQLMKKGLNKKYSFKQVMSYLDSYQMARTSVSGSWQPVTMLSYIKGLADKLGV